jgi:hypothetical protein
MKKHIRVTPSAFNTVLSRLPQKTHGWAIELELLVFLYWMAAGCSYRVAGGFIGISLTTVADIVHKMLDSLPRHLQTLVALPTVAEFPEIGEIFRTSN